MIMSRDVHDAVDDARNGNMSSYNALPLKKCTPTSGHQIWQPNVKDGEAVCLAHQSRCKVNWNAESFNADRFNGLTTNFGTPTYDVHDAVNDARNGNMSSYNALPLKKCTPTSGHQIWQPNVKDGEAVCLAHQSRCKVNWNTISNTTLILSNIDYPIPTKSVNTAPMVEHGKNSYFNKEHDCYQCGKCHTAFDEESDANYCCTACYACGYADHVGFERAQKCCPCTCAETGGGPDGTCQEMFGSEGLLKPCGDCGRPSTHSARNGTVNRCDRCWHDELAAEYKNIESKPYQHLLLGVAFTVCGLYFWSTAGSYVRNWVVVRVEKYAPSLLTPTSQVILTTAALFGIIGFGWKLYGSTKGTTIGSIDGLLGGIVEPID